MFACVQIKTIEVLDCFSAELLQIQSPPKKVRINNSRLYGSKYLLSEMNLAEADPD